MLIGDSGENQTPCSPSPLPEQGGEDSTHVCTSYRSTTRKPFPRMVQGRGRNAKTSYARGHPLTTSQFMAVEPECNSHDKRAAGGDRTITGAASTPRASVAYGKKGLEMKIEAAVAQIRN